MNDLEVEFDSESEEGRKVMISAKFEFIEDYIETPYGEKREVYWHLVGIKIKPFNCHCYPSCFCYEPTNSEYNEFETEAKKLASKEAA
jgi:hypothetical protein